MNVWLEETASLVPFFLKSFFHGKFSEGERLSRVAYAPTRSVELWCTKEWCVCVILVAWNDLRCLKPMKTSSQRHCSLLILPLADIVIFLGQLFAFICLSFTVDIYRQLNSLLYKFVWYRWKYKFLGVACRPPLLLFLEQKFKRFHSQTELWTSRKPLRSVASVDVLPFFEITRQTVKVLPIFDTCQISLSKTYCSIRKGSRFSKQSKLAAVPQFYMREMMKVIGSLLTLQIISNFKHINNKTDISLKCRLCFNLLLWKMTSRRKQLQEI